MGLIAALRTATPFHHIAQGSLAPNAGLPWVKVKEAADPEADRTKIKACPRGFA